jgi:hypothetical protein
MKKYLVLMIALAYTLVGKTTPCSLSGNLYFGNDLEAVANYKIELAFFSEEIFLADTTAADGSFFFEFELDFEGVNPIFGTLAVTDFCSGAIVIEPVIFLEQFPDVEGQQIVLCSDINPPPPPYSCEPFFQFQQAAADPYIVKFFDISSTTDPVDSWWWDFGDGASSTSENPSYEYEATGDYLVSLTITADTCENTYSRWVTVSDSIACDCNGIFDPVCVVLPEGDTIPFLNSCFAECEGYDETQYSSCINACEADFEASPTAIPGQIQFNDLSQSVGGSIIGWYWDFGDGGSSTEQNPVYAFSEAGMASVSLQINTTTGCFSNLNQEVLVSSVTNTFDLSGNYVMSAFPNPATDRLHLQLDSASPASNCLIRISGMDGKARIVHPYEWADGQSTLEIDISQLSAGVYILNAIHQEDIYTLKFVKK